MLDIYIMAALFTGGVVCYVVKLIRKKEKVSNLAYIALIGLMVFWPVFWASVFYNAFLRRE